MGNEWYSDRTNIWRSRRPISLTKYTIYKLISKCGQNSNHWRGERARTAVPITRIHKSNTVRNLLCPAHARSFVPHSHSLCLNIHSGRITVVWQGFSRRCGHQAGLDFGRQPFELRTHKRLFDGLILCPRHEVMFSGFMSLNGDW